MYIQNYLTKSSPPKVAPPYLALHLGLRLQRLRCKNRVKVRGFDRDIGPIIGHIWVSVTADSVCLEMRTRADGGDHWSVLATFTRRLRMRGMQSLPSG